MIPEDTETEKWLPVIGYETNYLISSQGRIWSKPRATTRGGLMKLIVMPDGYRIVGLTLDGIQKNYFVHCLMAETFIGPRPNQQVVRHLDGHPENNSLSNIRYGTRVENSKDIIKHHRNKNALKTHCPRGHAYTEENIYRDKRGSRTCRACVRERALERSYRKTQSN
jgi:HNH endonuclease/NUMOD4 motif